MTIFTIVSILLILNWALQVGVCISVCFEEKDGKDKGMLQGLQGGERSLPSWAMKIPPKGLIIYHSEKVS